jgi:hypothetical protein
MKAFLVVLLAAVAYAAPEADAEADPAYFYSHLGYNYSPYAAYAPYGYAAHPAYAYRSAYAYHPYSYTYASRFYKREAEADAEADPALFYSTYGYNYAAHPYAYANAYAHYPYTYTHAAYHPTVVKSVAHVAAPAVVKTVAHTPAVVATKTVATAPVAAAVAAPALTYTHAVPHVVAKPVSYYANSGGAVHTVAKREADAWGPYGYYRGYYGRYGYPYGRRGYYGYPYGRYYW